MLVLTKAPMCESVAVPALSYYVQDWAASRQAWEAITSQPAEKRKAAQRAAREAANRSRREKAKLEREKRREDPAYAAKADAEKAARIAERPKRKVGCVVEPERIGTSDLHPCSE